MLMEDNDQAGYREEVEPIKPVKWTASEYIAHEKNNSWYLIFAGAGLVLVGVVYLVTQDILASIVVLLAIVALGVAAGRKPSTRNYEISEDGVKVGERLYPFGVFKSFSVVEEGGIDSIQLKHRQRLTPMVVMYFSPEDEEKIFNALSKFLPHQQRELDFSSHEIAHKEQKGLDSKAAAMKYLKKFLLFLASTFVISLLVATATVWIFRFTLGDRGVVKSWFVESGAYENFVDEVVDASAKASQENTDAASIDIGLLRTAAKDAFTPQVLQEAVEEVIDGTYDWVEQKNPSLQFTIDLNEPKKNFVKSLSNSVLEKAKELPTCETFEIPEEIDIFAVDCLPANIDPDQLSDDFARELDSAEDFLGSPVFTQDDIKVDKNGVDVPIGEAYPWIPTWYARAMAFTWGVLALTVLASFILIFLAKSHRRGAVHLMRALLLVTLSTTVFAFISQRIPISLSGVGGGDKAAEDFAERVVEPFVNVAIDTFANWNYVFALIFGSFGVTIALILVLTRDKHKKLEHKEPPHDNDTAMPVPPPDDSKPAEPPKQPDAQKEGLDKHKTITDVEHQKKDS